MLAEEVRRACTHGNCVHGFYSKYTVRERMYFYAWAIGLPVVALIGYGLITAQRPESDGDAQMRPRIRQEIPQAAKASSVAKARKEWRCRGCSARIAPGAECYYYVSYVGDYASRERYCVNCRKAAVAARQSVLSRESLKTDGT